MRRWLGLVAMCALLCACGGDGGGGSGEDGGTDDGGEDADTPSVCSSDENCDDGVYCNGAETCMPDADDANDLGCVVGSEPCEAGEVCNEDTQSCGACSEGADADGDGHDARTCGGDDCDDTDPNRYPGNTEVCDADGHDEDCDPTTLGGDEDGDGYASDECCNIQNDGSLSCGLDCDDSSSGMNPEAVDSCNGMDEDCDGEIDENPDELFYRDRDGDDFGVETESVMACGAPTGFAVKSGDCDDDFGSVNPGAAEVCEGDVDEDCDGAIDEECPCTPEGATESCGPPEAGTGVCRNGTRTCTAVGWSDCVDDVLPSMERCDGENDEDCDGDVDEGCDCVNGTTRRCGMDTGVCKSVLQTCSGGAWPRPCSEESGVIEAGDEVCDGGSDEDCDSVIDEGCSCVSGDTRPCGETTGACEAGEQMCSSGSWGTCDGATGPSTEECNGIDDDCDGNSDGEDPDVVGTGATCGTNQGLCSRGTEICDGSSIVCGGSGYQGPASETCDHQDEDCDGYFDEGVARSTCEKRWESNTSTDEIGNALEGCMPSFCDYVSHVDRLEMGEQDGSQQPRVAYIDTDGSDLDYGDTWTVGATFWVNGTPRASYGVLITPNLGVGSDSDDGLPSTSGGVPGYAAVFTGGFEQVVRIYELTSSGPIERAESATLSGCGPSGTDRFYVSITNFQGRFRAYVEGLDCGNSEQVEWTDSDWNTDAYGETPSYPTFRPGVVGDADGSVSIEVGEVYVDRPAPFSIGGFRDHRGFCEPCPW